MRCGRVACGGTSLPAYEANAATHVDRVDRASSLRGHGHTTAATLSDGPRVIDDTKSTASARVEHTVRTSPPWDVGGMVEHMSNAIAEIWISTVTKTAARDPSAIAGRAKNPSPCGRRRQSNHSGASDTHPRYPNVSYKPSATRTERLTTGLHRPAECGG